MLARTGVIAVILALATAFPALAQHAWLELAPGGGLVARAITTAAACPMVDIDGSPRSMDERAAPDHGFPVRVCTTPVPATAARVTVNGRQLPMAGGPYRRIAVVGATGCRIRVKHGVPWVQACNDPDAWPARRVARAIAHQDPDLVIHVGDYVFRESACPFGNMGCHRSPRGDIWATWNADFFQPMGPALAAAPWVMLRGRQEKCGRFGNGWFRLLAPGPRPEGCPVHTEPYAIDLGPARLVVMDSAAAGPDQVDAAIRVFAGQFKAVGDLAQDDKPAWLAVSHPLYGAPQTPATSNPNLVMAAAGELPAAIGLILSGHARWLELVDTERRPVQAIAGSGGTLLEDAQEIPANLLGQEVRDQRVDAAATLGTWGFLMLEAEGPVVRITAHDAQGQARLHCRVNFAGAQGQDPGRLVCRQ